jgi:transposase
LKQIVGIDVAQKELVVTLGKLHEDLSIELYAYKVFSNKEKGFETLLKWVETLTNEDFSIHYVMEATGIYHQKFAYYIR